MSASLVELTRGPLVDAVHRGDVALVAADGRLLASVGRPVEKLAYWRSSAKPFQALPVVESGAAERWDLSAEDLALIAGSHNGEPIHVDRARSLMQRIGASAADLACGVHPPLDPVAARALVASGKAPTVLHNNCCGKHLGMIALAGHRGLERHGYQAADHPVQQEILATVACFSGLPPDRIAIGLDGCQVPCFGTSVYHLALAFARFAQPRPSVPGALADAADSVRAAMIAHPYLVAGRARLDTDLMQSRVGLVSKGGAGGVECVGFCDGSIGLGLAVKIEDGAAATAPAHPAGLVVIQALRQLGVLDESALLDLREYAYPALRTVAGEAVGEARATFKLDRPASFQSDWSGW